MRIEITEITSCETATSSRQLDEALAQGGKAKRVDHRAELPLKGDQSVNLL